MPSRTGSAGIADFTSTSSTTSGRPPRPCLCLLALNGPLAPAEPKTLRYRIRQAVGRPVRSDLLHYLKIAATWPRAPAIVTTWDRVVGGTLAQAP